MGPTSGGPASAIVASGRAASAASAASCEPASAVAASAASREPASAMVASIVASAGAVSAATAEWDPASGPAVTKSVSSPPLLEHAAARIPATVAVIPAQSTVLRRMRYLDGARPRAVPFVNESGSLQCQRCGSQERRACACRPLRFAGKKSPGQRSMTVAFGAVSPRNRWATASKARGSSVTRNSS